MPHAFHMIWGEGCTTAHPLVYLDKDNSSNGFQDQHDCHGEGVDAGIVLHVGIVLHAVTHIASVPLEYCGVLFGGKVPWGEIPETPRSLSAQGEKHGEWPGHGKHKAILLPTSPFISG